MNAKIIEGLKAVRDGIELILAGCVDDYEPAVPAKNEDKAVSETKPKEVLPETVEETAPEAKVEGTLTREQLDGMTYNNIKKLAKEMGVSAVGNREEITNRILGCEAEAEEVTETTEAPVEVEVDEKDNDPVYAKVVEAVAEMDSEDLADILADVGISAKGKRETLIEKIVQAVKDGLIEFDEDEEETVEENIVPLPTTAPAVEEAEEEEEDDVNDLDNPNMTEARKKALINQDNSIRKQFKNGDVTRDNLVEFLQSFYDTEEDMDDMSDDDLLDTYIDAVCRLVDDDGDLIEEGAYTLNGEPACCGRALSYSEDTNVFICEHCGEEYEAE